MRAATNADGLTLINFGIGSPNAATIMDLLVAREPKGCSCSASAAASSTRPRSGTSVLPIAAIRGEGTRSDDYFPAEVPALPSFKLHKFVSEKIVDRGHEYRTGVVYTTNRRVWEHDEAFLVRLKQMRCIAIDMEVATALHRRALHTPSRAARSSSSPTSRRRPRGSRRRSPTRR